MLHLLNSLFNFLVDRFIDILMIGSITNEGGLGNRACNVTTNKIAAWPTGNKKPEQFLVA